jgi:hypothetical protein
MDLNQKYGLFSFNAQVDPSTTPAVELVNRKRASLVAWVELGYTLKFQFGYRAPGGYL